MATKKVKAIVRKIVFEVPAPKLKGDNVQKFIDAFIYYLDRSKFSFDWQWMIYCMYVTYDLHFSGVQKYDENELRQVIDDAYAYAKKNWRLHIES